MCPTPHHLAYISVYTSDLIGVAISCVPEAPPRRFLPEICVSGITLGSCGGTMRSPRLSTNALRGIGGAGPATVLVLFLVS